MPINTRLIKLKNNIHIYANTIFIEDTQGVSVPLINSSYILYMLNKIYYKKYRSVYEKHL